MTRGTCTFCSESFDAGDTIAEFILDHGYAPSDFFLCPNCQKTFDSMMEKIVARHENKPKGAQYHLFAVFNPSRCINCSMTAEEIMTLPDEERWCFTQPEDSKDVDQWITNLLLDSIQSQNLPQN